MWIARVIDTLFAIPGILFCISIIIVIYQIGKHEGSNQKENQ